MGLSAQQAENAQIYPGELILSLATELENKGGNLKLDQLKIKQVFPIKMINLKCFQPVLLIGVDEITTINHLPGQVISMILPSCGSEVETEGILMIETPGRRVLCCKSGCTVTQLFSGELSFKTYLKSIPFAVEMGVDITGVLKPFRALKVPVFKNRR